MLNQNASVNDVRTILADSGSNNKTVCDGSGRGYFTEDADSNPEPLLYLFDAIRPIIDNFSYNNATVTDNFLTYDNTTTGIESLEITPLQAKQQSQPLLQQESVAEANTDGATTASTTPPATTSNFLAYENSTYGLKISYPANWTYYGTAEYGGFIDIVIFQAPLEGRTDPSSALFMVSRDTLPSDMSTSLKDYADSIIDQYKQSMRDFNLIESSTDGSIKLLNRPAYRIVSTNVQDDITYKTLEIGTIIGNKVYLITYDAEEAEFSKYQPIVQDMINSFQVGGLLDNGISAGGETVTKQYDSSNMTFGSNATLDSGNANVLSDAADALRNSGGFDEAIELYDEALAINLNNFAMLNTGPGSVGIVPISVLNVDSRTHTRD
jgi:hypothetical protein